MANVRVIVDEHEYSENQFKKDLIRMFDAYRYHDSGHMGEPNCKGVVCSINCPLGVEGKCCNVTNFDFGTIKIVYNWAKEHPVVTNHDKLIKTFGNKNFNFILSSLRNDMIDEYGVWLNEEYKEPQEEKEK